jgi:hypothetical protein
MAMMAANDESPVVRLYLAAGIRRLKPELRVRVLAGLVSHDDSADPNLPLVIWYAAEGLAEADLPSALGLLKLSKIPLIREFMARRISALGVDRPILNVVSMGATGDGVTDDSVAFQKAIDQLAATGGRVLVPWSVNPFRIAKPLVVTSDHLEIWGPGAKVSFPPGGSLSVGPTKDFQMRGFRIDGASGPILKLDRVRDAVLEDLQIRGGASMTGVENVTISASRFDLLELREAGEGKPASRLRGLSANRTYKVDGVSVEDFQSPK